MHSGFLTIAGNGFECRSPNGANPLLRALSEDSNRFADRIEISDLQPDQFRNPEPTRVEELKNRLVAASHPLRSLLLPLDFRWFFEQGFHLRNRQKPRNVFFKFRDVDGFENVGVEKLTENQELVEATQRRESQPNARARTTGLHEVQKKGAKIVYGRVFPGEAWPKPAEGAKGMTVARYGMLRSIPLALKIGYKLSREQVLRLGVTPL
jgi:hypothetical protein